MTQADPGAARAAVAALRGAAQDAQIDARYGVPTFLWGAQASATMKAQGAAPTAKAGLDHEAGARAYLRDLADLYRISPAEVDALRLHSVSRLANGGAIVRLRGEIDGIEVFREQFNVLLGSDGALVSIGGFAMGAPAAYRKHAQASVATAADAGAGALRDFGFAPDVAARFAQSDAEGGYVRLALPAGAAGNDGATLAHPARAKRVWFRVGADLVPAWYVEVAVRDGQNRRHVDNYAYVVSAVDGSLLFRRSQVAHAAFSYRVLAEPSPPYLPLPGPGGRGGFPHPTGNAERLPAALRRAEPRDAREPAVQPERSVAPPRRDAHHRQQRRGVRRPASSRSTSVPPTRTSATSRSRSTATSTRARAPPGRSTTRTTSRRSRTPAARRSWRASRSCST